MAKSKKTLLIIIAAVLVAAIAAGVVFLVCNGKGAQYSKAVSMIEDGNFKDGYDELIEIAEKDRDYKDVKDILYNDAIELIETDILDNKKVAYRMLMAISGYKYADEIMYYLWVEDVYDPEDDTTFEQADGFLAMISEKYDGPFAGEVQNFRAEVKKSIDELNRKKYEAAMEAEAEMLE